MKRLFFSLALASTLAIPALAYANSNMFEVNCAKGDGKCSKDFNKVYEIANVTLTCTDGSTLYDDNVSSPNALIICQSVSSSKSQNEYICDAQNQTITYDIKSHFKCK